MDERLRFGARLLEGEKMAPLCAQFGISRKTTVNPMWPCRLEPIDNPFRPESVTHVPGMNCYPCPEWTGTRVVRLAGVEPAPPRGSSNTRHGPGVKTTSTQ